MIDLAAIRWLADIPAAQAKVRGDEAAVLFEGATTTYAELDRQSVAMMRAVVAAGVRAGDRVSCLTKNNSAWYPMFFGTALARACLMPVNCRLSASEIEFILSDGAPRLLFVGEDFSRPCSPRSARWSSGRGSSRCMVRIPSSKHSKPFSRAATARPSKPSRRSMTTCSSSTPAGRRGGPRAWC